MSVITDLLTSNTSLENLPLIDAAISGQITKPARTSQFTFQETTANSMIANASKWYFKSLDKIVSSIQTTVKFPQAPTGTNLVTNGTFDTDITGWTPFDADTVITNPTNTLSFTSTVGNGLVGTPVTTEIGKKYTVELKLVSDSAGTSRIYIQTALGVGTILFKDIDIGYVTVEFTAISTTTWINVNSLSAGSIVVIDNVAVFAQTDLFRYDNLLLRDDGTYFITQTETNLYEDMDTMLNYTSNLFSVVDGSDTATSVTFTYDTTNEEYSGSDGFTYITVGSTARFNQGAYHPVYNKYGTAEFGDALPWYSSTDAKANTADCFTTVGNGAIVGAASGRPDAKFYDIIYNELFIDQRWKAEYTDASKELTTVERDKDISATQYADFVGSATWETLLNWSATPSTKGYNGAIGYTYVEFGAVSPPYAPNLDSADFNALDRTEWLGFIKDASGAYYSVKFQNIHTGDSKFYVYFADHYGDVSATVNIVGNCEVYIQTKTDFRYGSNTFLQTDIIGDPANYPADWLTTLAGGGTLDGVPLLVGEKGEDLVPDGTQYTIKGLKKLSLQYDVELVSTDSGLTWAASGVVWHPITNDFNTIWGTGYIWLIPYKAYNNNLAPIVNSAVEKGSAGISDVFAGIFHEDGLGSVLCSNVISKIPINSSLSNYIIRNSKLDSSTLHPALLTIRDTTYYPAPSHNTLDISGVDSPAVKLFSYLTQATRAKQVYVFKEMYFDDTVATGTDFIDTIEGDIDTTAVGSNIHVTTGSFVGYYTILVDSAVDYSDSRFSTDENGNVMWDGRTMYLRKWDGNGFGDNNKFDIVDNVSTTTDDNGNVVMIGQKARLIDGRTK